MHASISISHRSEIISPAQEAFVKIAHIVRLFLVLRANANAQCDYMSERMSAMFLKNVCHARQLTYGGLLCMHHS
jgi:hypothetical protein